MKKIILNIQKFSNSAEAGTTVIINESATLTDVDASKQSRVLRLLGNTSQTGTPTPSSPIPINVVSGDNTITSCGRNLAYTGWAEDYVSRINNSTQASIQTKDNKNTLKWTAAAGYPDYDAKYIFKTNWKENTQYTFAMDLFPTNPTSRDNLQILYTDGTFTEINSTYNTWSHIVVTSNANKTIKYICPYYRSNETYLDLDTFMVEEGTSESPYEPYVSSSYQVNLPIENLFDKDTANYNKGIDSSGNLGNNTNLTTSDYIQVQPNTSYYLSNTIGSTYGRCCAYYDESKIFISAETKTGQVLINTSVTTPNNAKYMRVACATGNENILQVEKGTKSNSYTPFGITPIELCKIGTYQDYIYKEGKKWYKYGAIGKYAFTGNENWGLFFNTNGVFVNQTEISALSDTTGTNFMSNYFANTYSRSYIRSHLDTIDNVFSVNGVEVVMANKDLTSASDFKTWLSTHNTIVYYVLATPTTTEITDSTLIEQLETLKSNEE